MRDDDDSSEVDPPTGNLYHSGIRPDDHIEPASYALPPGVPALEGEGVYDLDSDESQTNPRRGVIDRRQAFAFGLGGLAVGAGSIWFGFGVSGSSKLKVPETRHRRLGTRLTQEDLKLLATARAWADAPIELLVRAAPSFLWTFHVIEPDEVFTNGMIRLCDYALLQGGKSGYETSVLLLATFQEVSAPPEFARFRPRLQDLVWQWQTSKQRSGK